MFAIPKWVKRLLDEPPKEVATLSYPTPRYEPPKPQEPVYRKYSVNVGEATITYTKEDGSQISKTVFGYMYHNRYWYSHISPGRKAAEQIEKDLANKYVLDNDFDPKSAWTFDSASVNVVYSDFWQFHTLNEEQVPLPVEYKLAEE